MDHRENTYGSSHEQRREPRQLQRGYGPYERPYEPQREFRREPAESWLAQDYDAGYGYPQLGYGAAYDEQVGRLPYRGESYIGARPNYRGIGPRNFVRSDDRILESIGERLFDDPSVDASDIGISVREGVVKLEGTVGERWMKHRVEDIAECCAGVKDVENHIRVKRQEPSSLHDEDRSGTSASSKGGKSH